MINECEIKILFVELDKYCLGEVKLDSIYCMFQTDNLMM